MINSCHRSSLKTVNDPAWRCAALMTRSSLQSGSKSGPSHWRNGSASPMGRCVDENNGMLQQHQTPWKNGMSPSKRSKSQEISLLFRRNQQISQAKRWHGRWPLSTGDGRHGRQSCHCLSQTSQTSFVPKIFWRAENHVQPTVSPIDLSIWEQLQWEFLAETGTSLKLGSRAELWCQAMAHGHVDFGHGPEVWPKIHGCVVSLPAFSETPIRTGMIPSGMSMDWRENLQECWVLSLISSGFPVFSLDPHGIWATFKGH